MGALIRYVVAGTAISQRYLPLTLLFLATVAVLTSNPGGTLVSRYAACALAQFVCMTWLTMVVINVEHPVQRSVTSVTAGGARRVLIGNVLAAFAAHLALIVVGLLYPMHAGTGPAAALVVGFLAQLTAGMAGIAVGLLCSRLVIPRPG